MHINHVALSIVVKILIAHYRMMTGSRVHSRTGFSYISANRHELAMLRRDVKRLSSVVTAMSEKMDLLIAAADRGNAATADLANAPENAREDARTSSVEESAIMSPSSEVDIIPWPSTCVSEGSSEKMRRVSITKALIITALIKPFRKDENGQDLSYAKLTAIYGSIRDMRKDFVMAAIHELGYCTCKPPVGRCRCGAAKGKRVPTQPVRWGQLSPRYRYKMIANFEAIIFEKERIPIHRCEKHWAASHMLEEGWCNWIKKMRTPTQGEREGKFCDM
ncbi:hypothetical protein BX666DRAFT_963350 [Dichotomocladium elegans]|nr:hypothetical protein BX666DRAFT_963350 [Dichotomocladium elegans]